MEVITTTNLVHTMGDGEKQFEFVGILIGAEDVVALRDLGVDLEMGVDVHVVVDAIFVKKVMTKTRASSNTSSKCCISSHMRPIWNNFKFKVGLPV